MAAMAIRVAILAIAALVGGWLSFDGTRALVRGDYTTPASGPHAGELGPWARVVSAVGLEPRSTGVKAAHVVLGLAWLASAMAFLCNPAAGRIALGVSSICTLWYLPIGTVLAIAELVMLISPQVRALP